MAKIYAKKIMEHAINPSTNIEWCLDDVPERWREQTRKIIEGERK